MADCRIFFGTPAWASIHTRKACVLLEDGQDVPEAGSQGDLSFPFPPPAPGCIREGQEAETQDSACLGHVVLPISHGFTVPRPKVTRGHDLVCAIGPNMMLGTQSGKISIG